MAMTTPPQPGAAAPGSAVPGAGPGAQAPQTLTPQQLQQMQLVVKQCMSLLLQDQTAQMIVAKCQQGDPAQTVADIVAPLLAKVHESARGAGADVDMVTMMVAGVQVIGTLAEMLWHADVLKSEKEIPAFVAKTAQLAVASHNSGLQQGNGGQPAAPAGGGMIAQQPGA